MPFEKLFAPAVQARSSFVLASRVAQIEFTSQKSHPWSRYRHPDPSHVAHPQQQVKMPSFGPRIATADGGTSSAIPLTSTNRQTRPSKRSIRLPPALT